MDKLFCSHEMEYILKRGVKYIGRSDPDIGKYVIRKNGASNPFLEVTTKPKSDGDYLIEPNINGKSYHPEYARWNNI
jgi:hypothetical protein